MRKVITLTGRSQDENKPEYEEGKWYAATLIHYKKRMCFKYSHGLFFCECKSFKQSELTDIIELDLSIPENKELNPIEFVKNAVDSTVFYNANEFDNIIHLNGLGFDGMELFMAWDNSAQNISRALYLGHLNDGVY